MPSSVVVYNSRMEQMQDEYWMEFMENHPDLILWFYSIFLGIFALIFFAVTFKIISSFFKFNKNKRRF